MAVRLVPVCLAALVAVLARPAPAAAASWTWPMAAPHRIVHGFAPPLHDWLPGHRGVDLAGTVRGTVVAAGPGRVVLARDIGGVGVVAVRHAGGLETTYEPVVPVVRVGTVVAAGTPIGRLRGDHSHCGPQPCLHWGLRRGGDYLDPLTLVGAGRIRLLPLNDTGIDWLVPAVSGASVGSSAVVVGWAFAMRRRSRRPLPDGVVSLEERRRACPRDPSRPSAHRCPQSRD